MTVCMSTRDEARGSDQILGMVIFVGVAPVVARGGRLHLIRQRNGSSRTSTLYTCEVWWLHMQEWSHQTQHQ
jgi:hypothetical protein